MITGQPQAAGSMRFCPPSGSKLPPSSATSARRSTAPFRPANRQARSRPRPAAPPRCAARPQSLPPSISAATSSKRCGWRGTIIHCTSCTRLAIERIAPCSGGTGEVAPKRLSTSSSNRSSPSRELASTTIGRGRCSRSDTARGQLPRVGRGVEFQVAVDAGDLGAERHQPVRVGFGLRPHGRERRVRRPCQPRQPLGRGQRFFVEPRIGQHQRNAALGTGRRHFGPDLGFHQHADARLELVQKTRHGARRVPRLPDLCIARFEQLGAFVAAGGGAMRSAGSECPGTACATRRSGWRQRVFRRARRMHPALGMASGSFVVVAEALFNRHAIAGLGHRPTPAACGEPAVAQQ
jgi:hypothetical protein